MQVLYNHIFLHHEFRSWRFEEVNFFFNQTKFHLTENLAHGDEKVAEKHSGVDLIVQVVWN